MIASGIALAGMGCVSSKSGNSNDSSVASTSKAGEQVLSQFGLQLYTLREDLPKDPKGILKQVSEMGYKQIEGYEGAQGLWWGMTPGEFKSYVDGLGIPMIASHCKFEEDFERKAAESAQVGLKYLIAPYIGPQKTMDDYKRFADKFNNCGDICKKNGLRFAYHNHGYTFEKLDGQYPQDVLMQSTNQDTVDYEMDIYWVVVPGEDPVTWLQKYPNRFRLCHVKDRMKTAAKGEADASTEVGNGSIDYKRILKVAKENGMQHYIVEQERYENSTPLKSAQASAQYMKTFAF